MSGRKARSRSSARRSTAPPEPVKHVGFGELPRKYVRTLVFATMRPGRLADESFDMPLDARAFMGISVSLLILFVWMLFPGNPIGSFELPATSAWVDAIPGWSRLGCCLVVWVLYIGAILASVTFFVSGQRRFNAVFSVLTYMCGGPQCLVVAVGLTLPFLIQLTHRAAPFLGVLIFLVVAPILWVLKYLGVLVKLGPSGRKGAWLIVATYFVTNASSSILGSNICYIDTIYPSQAFPGILEFRDQVVVNTWALRHRDPRVGDLVRFHDAVAGRQYGLVVAAPGDSIRTMPGASTMAALSMAMAMPQMERARALGTKRWNEYVWTTADSLDLLPKVVVANDQYGVAVSSTRMDLSPRERKVVSKDDVEGLVYYRLHPRAREGRILITPEHMRR